jgi:UDP-glucose 4-epimerase
MKILVTGGAGYIGTHTCVELLTSGHEVVVVDNLSNSSARSLERVERITGKPVPFHQTDLLDAPALQEIFFHETVDAVIHFAGYKAVGESVANPFSYYHNNICGTLSLLSAMKAANVRHLVFSSSATVYGEPASLPITESFPVSGTNPYGRTKLMIEEMLQDMYRSDPDWHIALLRYFNPVGAHDSGHIGEDPRGVPNNLLPYIARVAVGLLPEVMVFGNDYDTPDGTGVRDFIHVTDLAIGHIRTLERLISTPGILVYNLGTGQGYSVLEMIQAFGQASGRDIPYRIGPRRPGDIGACWADPSKARAELGWKADKTLADMCESTWNWQQRNPSGYEPV